MINTFRFDNTTMKILRDLAEHYDTDIPGALQKAIGLLKVESVHGPFYAKDREGVEELLVQLLGAHDEIHENQVPEQE
jgi:hypothetical protein